jgi:ligand-binding sensor domain-containing protein
MNNPILQSTPSVRLISLILLISLGLLSGITQAGDLRIEPAAPIIAVGESIQLTVTGAEGKITWFSPQAGNISENTQARTIYTAPNKVGQYGVRVKDRNSSNNSDSAILVTVLPEVVAKRAFSREKSVWEIFTNRDSLTTFALSETGETVWVGTQGGLEKRDVTNTGEFKLTKVFTNSDGLPDNMITAIVDSGNDELWVGTALGGLAHKNSHDEWEVFNTDNSELPNNYIWEVVNDGKGGVWIATGTPFDEEKVNRWLNCIFNLISNNGSNPFDNLFGNTNFSPSSLNNSANNNSCEDLFSGLNNNGGSSLFGLFDNPTDGIFSNPFGGNTENGLFYDGQIDNNGGSLFDSLFNNTEDSPSNNPFSNIGDNLLDESAYDNILLEQLTSALDCIKGNSIFDFIFDLSGDKGGLVHLSKEGQWTVFNTSNSKLPTNIITAIANDGKNGLWIGTYCEGLIHLTDPIGKSEWTFYDVNNSDLPGNFITLLYQGVNDGLWVGTALPSKISYLNNRNEWTVYNSANTRSSNSLLTLFDSSTDNTELSSNFLTSSFSTRTDDYFFLSDGEGGVLMGTGQPAEKDSLAHFKNNGELAIFYTNSDLSAIDPIQSNPSDSALPNNSIRHIVNDGNGGVWVGANNDVFGIDTSVFGMGNGGLAHLNSRKEWISYNVSNSDLPNKNIGTLAILPKKAVAIDNNEPWEKVLGVGTNGGLVLIPLNEFGESFGQWEIYNTSNSGLPHNKIFALLNDGNEGLWVRTEKGLSRRSNSGEWELFDYHSNSPDKFVGALMNDDNGGLWMGTGYGLVHRTRHDEWTVYDVNNSQLPHNMIAALMSDGNGGLWIATGTETQGGLVHLSVNEEWTIYNTTNSDLPSNGIHSLASDGSGGVWIGTLNGLVHRSLRDDWTVFQTTNSDLPYKQVFALANDGSNGLWVSSWGIAHLTFSQKPILCEKVPNITEEQCVTILQGNRAAIVIHPDGSGSGYNQDIVVDNMATHVYQTLFVRGYDHDEIYYIAHKPSLDFNGDGFPDSEVVDAPITLQDDENKKESVEQLTVEHLEKAFKWAADRHNDTKADNIPEEPLVVIFIGHGSENELLLGPSDNTLNESKFKEFLDDYQAITGNKVVVIIEACHTGTLVDALQAPNRLIVTSTDKNRAYYKDLGYTSFTRFYFDDLHRGTDYWNSRQFVKDSMFAKLGAPLSQQNPQLEDLAYDKMAKSSCLNDCYGQLPEPELKPEQPRFVSESSIELAVGIEGNNNDIINVSVSVITPQKANQYNEQGFELSHPLLIGNLTEEKDDRWITHFSDFAEAGEYHFIFRALYTIRSGSRTVSALQPVTVSWCQPHAHYNVETETLHLPVVKMPNDSGEETLFQADFVLINIDPITLKLNAESMVSTSHTNMACLALFDSSTNMLSIPAVDIPNNIGGVDTFSAELQRVTEILPWQFTLKSLVLQ